MIRRVVSLAVAVLITGVAVWFLVTPEVVRELRAVAAVASWPALAVATLIGALVQWLRAWRFAIMTSGSLRLPGLALVRIAFQLNFLNFALPFRLGELGYPVLMRRAYGQPVLGAIGVLLLARLFDLCSVGAILIVMSVQLSDEPSIDALLYVAAAALAFAPVALVFGANALHALVSAIPGVGERIPGAFDAARISLGNHRAQLAAIAVSFAIWLVFGGLAMLAANAVAKVPATVALLGASAGNLAFALPINGVAGLGASQAAWALAVNWAGIPWTDAVITALSVYAVTLAGAILFGGAAMLAPASRRDTPKI